MCPSGALALMTPAIGRWQQQRNAWTAKDFWRTGNGHAGTAMAAYWRAKARYVRQHLRDGVSVSHF